MADRTFGSEANGRSAHVQPGVAEAPEIAHIDAAVRCREEVGGPAKGTVADGHAVSPIGDALAAVFGIVVDVDELQGCTLQ